VASTSSTKVGLFPIPRPSVEEQIRICRFIDEKLNEIAQIVSSIEAQIATLNGKRRSKHTVDRLNPQLA
jgi:restriction endonuclease S subunit